MGRVETKTGSSQPSPQPGHESGPFNVKQVSASSYCSMWEICVEQQGMQKPPQRTVGQTSVSELRNHLQGHCLSREVVPLWAVFQREYASENWRTRGGEVQIAFLGVLRPQSSESPRGFQNWPLWVRAVQSLEDKCFLR